VLSTSGEPIQWLTYAWGFTDEWRWQTRNELSGVVQTKVSAIYSRASTP
jgi:hypothetical protein